MSEATKDKYTLEILLVLQLSHRDQPIREFLATNPPEWYPVLIEGIYECLKRRKPLTWQNVYQTTREIDAKRNPKGW